MEVVVYGIRINSSLRLSSLMLSYGGEVWGCNISRELGRKIEKI
jgi:hypothetical protein